MNETKVFQPPGSTETPENTEHQDDLETDYMDSWDCIPDILSRPQKAGILTIVAKESDAWGDLGI